MVMTGGWFIIYQHYRKLIDIFHNSNPVSAAGLLTHFLQGFCQKLQQGVPSVRVSEPVLRRGFLVTVRVRGSRFYGAKGGATRKNEGFNQSKSVIFMYQIDQICWRFYHILPTRMKIMRTHGLSGTNLALKTIQRRGQPEGWAASVLEKQSRVWTLTLGQVATWQLYIYIYTHI